MVESAGEVIEDWRRARLPLGPSCADARGGVWGDDVGGDVFTIPEESRVLAMTMQGKTRHEGRVNCAIISSTPQQGSDGVAASVIV